MSLIMSAEGFPPRTPPREVFVDNREDYPPLTPVTVSTVGDASLPPPGSWAAAASLPRRRLEGQLMKEATTSAAGSSRPRPPPPRASGYAAAAARNPAVDASADQGAKQATLLRLFTTDRDRTRKRIDQENAQLQRLIKIAPKRPKESRSALQQRIDKVEANRASRSLPASLETALLRQISAAEKSIRAHERADEHQKKIAKKKAVIELAREKLRAMDETISGIESSMSNAELAKKLGCLPAEVISRQVDCPMDKLDYVSGADGANIEAIEESTGARIIVDRLRGRIEVLGIASRVNEAVLQLEVYTKAIDDEVTVTPDAMAYLLWQQSSLLGKIRDDNPDVVIDDLSSVNSIKMRGLPDRVQKAKGAIESVKVVSKPHPLVGRQPSLVAGRLGSTIDSFSESHSVIMSVSHNGKDGSTLRIIGPPANVDAAMAEVDKLLYDNEEVVETFVVDPMLKSELLAKSGAGIRVFQSSLSEAVAAAHPEAGGVLLVFDRGGAPKDQDQKLRLKCSRCVMERAKSLAAKKLEEFRSNTESIDVPAEMIPVIIGKGGAAINELRKVGKGALVQADAGTIKVYSNDTATRDAIRKRIEQAVAENQVGPIPIEKATIPLILGDSGKDVREACAELGCTMAISKDDAQLVLKGTDEQIKEASELVKEFLAKHHVQELGIGPDEEALLLVGRSDANILQTIEKEHGVIASYHRSNNKLKILGEAGNVQDATEAINSFLNGGDGVTVSKINVPESAMGAVIGRGGSNIAKLEAEFEGVVVHIQKGSNCVSLRGPEDLVKQCQVRLSTKIATAKVSKSIRISQKQLRGRAKSDAIRRASRLYNVQITMSDMTDSESSITVKGTKNDVRDALSNIIELLTGVYSGYIDLSSEQFSTVNSAVKKETFHFKRIRDSTGADVALKAAESAIHISGKKSSVKKAKLSVLELLDFMLPKQLEAVELHRSLLKSVGDPQRLAEIAARTGTSIVLDRDLNSVLVNSDDPSDIGKATVLVKEFVAEKPKFNEIMIFDASETWLISAIIGPRGSTINKISTECECVIEVIQDEVTVVISADSEEAVRAGNEALQKVVDQARKQTVFIEMPTFSVNAFIGKGGEGIKQLVADHNVNASIERPKGCPARMRIHGKEECVAKAQCAVNSWVKQWEENNDDIDYMEVKRAMIPAVLGRGGETVRAIERDTGCRLSIDRERLTVAVRGGSDRDREMAMEKIKEILDVEETKAAARAAARAKRQAQVSLNKSPSAAEVEDRDSWKTSRPVDVAKLVEIKRQDSEITEEETASLETEQEENRCKSPTVSIEDEEQQLFRELLAGQGGDDSSDLGARVVQLLQEHIAERDGTQRRIDQETAQLEHLSKTTPKRPRETRSVLQQQAKKIESDRTDRSLPLAQEKALIRQLEATQKSIRLHDRVDQHQELIVKKKAEIESIREKLQSLDKAISDIETVLKKVELAKRFECLPSEVVSRDVAFPVSKLTWVLGEDKANITRVEESTRVSIEVDKSKGTLKVCGSELAVNEAVSLLEIYTKAVDEQVKVSPQVVSYLLARQSSALNAIRDDHPDVSIDVCNLSSIKMRGHPDRVQKAKGAIGGIQVVTKSRVLVDSEATLVVGETGSSDHRLSEKHDVVLTMSPMCSKSTLRIAGPSENVDAAMAELDRLLFQNDQATRTLKLPPLS